jgi:peptidoglycan/xylan/chitin deacetylase (PgdA/CDA1 family)
MRKVILNFHGIGPVQARALDTGEAPYWVTPDIFAQTVALAQSLPIDVDYTFDDGNQSDLTIAAPILADHDIAATFFVLADRIDQPGSLSTADLRNLVASGHEIGTHGDAHVNWKTANLNHELGSDTRQKIADAAGQPITKAAIPFGAYNGRVIRALRKNDYTQCYSSDGGAYKTGQYPIPRTSIRADMTMDDITNILQGREPLKTRLRRDLAAHVKKRL